MRGYGKISTSVWRSKKFRALGDGAAADRARLLYLHLHTCPSVNSVGCFCMPIGYAVAELGWDAKAVRAAIDSLSKAQLIEHNAAEQVIRIVDFIEHDAPTNPKHAQSVFRVARMVPDCAEKLHAIMDLATTDFGANVPGIRAEIDRLSVGYPAKVGGSPPFSLVPVPLSQTHTQSPQDCAGPSALTPTNTIDAPPAVPDEDPVLITLLTNKVGEVFEVRQAFYDQLASLYPGIADPAQQFRAMAAWLITNEKQRKTLNGMKRFINSWLSREQNRSGNNGRQQKETRNGNWLAGAAALAAELRGGAGDS